MIKRNTFQKDVILNVIRKIQGHPTLDDIYSESKKNCPNISKATVYRNITMLADEGIIKKIEFPNTSVRVDTILTPHYHFCCDKCKNVFDLDMDYIDNIYDLIKDKHNFEITSHRIIFTGLCDKCKNEKQLLKK